MTTEVIEIGGKTFTKYGVAEHSILGKNRFYQYCDFYNQRRCYSVCAGVVDDFLSEREWTKSQDSESSCIYAMRKGQCTAMPKRQLELKLNASLFYKSREVPEGEPVSRKQDVKQSAGYWIGWNKVGAKIGAAPQPKTAPQSQPQPKTAPQPKTPAVSYADAINEALKA